MSNQIKNVLELFSQPSFIAKDDQVLWCNTAARSLIKEGTPLTDIIEGKDELFSLWNREGTLQLSLLLQGNSYDTSVRVYEDGLLFVASAPSPEMRASAMAVLNASTSLRKPLHSLLSAAGELFEYTDHENARDAAAEVNRAIYQLMRLCGQMSDGSRLLLGQMEIRRTPTNLQKFFDHFISQVRPLIESAKRTLQYEPLDTSLQADIDPALLERALLNLFSNALAYTPINGTLSLRLQKQAKRLLVIVSDTGEGISSDVIANLFERYSDRPLGDSRWGLGYGLPMVREIARLHGGTMMVSATEGEKGTTAIFSLSLEPVPRNLRTPLLRYDYCSGLNHALVELSDSLGKELFLPQEI